MFKDIPIEDQVFEFEDPTPDGFVKNRISGREIIRGYFPRWSKLMRDGGRDEEDITPAKCIEDYTTVNWAWRVE